MSLQKFCQWPVVTIAPEMMIADACEMMWEKNIGSVVAVDAGKVCGMLTDRDVALKVVRERKDPRQTTVREIMTANPACIRVDKALSELTTLMRQHHVRRVPIVDDHNRPLGIVSFDDLLSLLSEEMSDMRQTVTEAFFRGRSDKQPAVSSLHNYWWSAALFVPAPLEEDSAQEQAQVDAFYRKLPDQKQYEWSLLCESI